MQRLIYKNWTWSYFRFWHVKLCEVEFLKFRKNTVKPTINIENLMIQHKKQNILFTLMQTSYIFMLCQSFFQLLDSTVCSCHVTTRFRVNSHSIVAWMSRNSLLEVGAKSEGEVTANRNEHSWTVRISIQNTARSFG